MLQYIFGLGSLVKGIKVQGKLPRERALYGMFFRIAWPAALEGLLIMMISSVDLIMVGTLGTDAVAAVGITSQPRMIILCFSRSLAVAITALTARRKGEGKKEELNTCLKQGMLLSVFLSTVILFVSMIFLKEILVAAGAHKEYLREAVEYGKYNMLALFFTGLSVGINAAQTGVGDTKIILWANVSGNVVNTVLNLFLIYGLFFFPEMGVGGAGLATVIGSMVSFGISLRSVSRRKTELYLWGSGGWRLDPIILKSFFRVGSSAFAEQIFERIGMFLYSYMVAGLGTVAFATHYICMNLCDVYYSFSQGMSKASSALTGQKLGEGRKDLAFISAKAGRRGGLILDLAAFLIYFFGRSLLMLIYSREFQVIELGSNILIFVAVCTFLQTQSMIYAGVLRGAGDTRYVAKYSFWDIAVFRPLLTYLLCFPAGLGIYGAWISLLADQFLRAYFASKRFHSKKWMEVEL